MSTRNGSCWVAIGVKSDRGEREGSMGTGVCAGIDWAKDSHDVFVADGDGGAVVGGEGVAHDEAGLGAACAGSLCGSGVGRVAIERPDGLLVDRLLDAGLTGDRDAPRPGSRPPGRGLRPAGGKSDRFDAFVLCELARTDHHRFRELVPDTDQTKALRVLTRGA